MCECQILAHVEEQIKHLSKFPNPVCGCDCMFFGINCMWFSQAHIKGNNFLQHTNYNLVLGKRGTNQIIFYEKEKVLSLKQRVAKNCALCAKERLEILKQSRSNPQLHQLQQRNLRCL